MKGTKTTAIRPPLLALCLLLPASMGAAQEKTYAPDAEGYLRNWLLFGPIPNEFESSGYDEVEKSQLPDEGRLAPMAGETAKVRGKTLTWKAYASPQFHVDFNRWLGNPGNRKAENCLGYLVAYVHSDVERRGLQCRMVSNDQAKLYLNGRKIHAFGATRRIEKGKEDVVRNVTLKKGRNVVVLKVVNESNDWGGGIRFTDGSGKPVTDLALTTPSKP